MGNKGGLSDFERGIAVVDENIQGAVLMSKVRDQSQTGLRPEECITFHSCQLRTEA